MIYHIWFTTLSASKRQQIKSYLFSLSVINFMGGYSFRQGKAGSAFWSEKDGINHVFPKSRNCY
uniref:Uncharacterized protein n=1 Tax=Arundo donax TaxID=35708 RepID=A0A0A8Y1V5_ARUDO